MSFTRCTHEDLFASKVRELYSANVVRAPRVGIDPLLVLAKSGDHVELRGALEPLLVDGDLLTLPTVTEADAPEISGSRSTELEAKLGLKLAASFLAALGVPVPGVSLDGTLWKGASGFTFEVRDVHEWKVDVNELGDALRGRRIDTSHPSAALFFDRDAQVSMHLITRTLVSRHVAVRATGSSGQILEASTSAITDLIGDVEGSLSWKRESDGAVSFQGEAPATFALAAVPLNLLPDGRFTFGLELRGGSYLDTPSGSDSELLTEHLPLVEDDGLLDIA